MKIYHNPRCQKSRETLQLIQEKGQKPEIIEYLKTPPSKAELTKLIKMLGVKPLDMIRKGEDDYKARYKGKTLSDEEWIEAMIAHPKLIERPIVVDGKRAILGRPPENVLELM